MRVWLVNHYAVPPSEPGGTRHYALARELIRRGHDVMVIASSFNHATGMQMSCTNGQGSTTVQFDEVPFLLLRVPAYRSKIARLWNMIVFAVEVWCCRGSREISKPDIVIGSSLTLLAALAASRLARRFRVPFVLEVRDLWPQTLIDMGMRPYHPAVVGFGFIERYLYRNADKIITLLPNASELIVSRGGRADDITWIPNGVDLSLMPLSAPVPHDVFTVMYAGSHGLSDALHPLLDAASILHKQAPGRFRFLFIGNGPTKDELRRKAQVEDIPNVTFEDPVPREQVLSKLQDADAFIISMKRADLYRYGISPNKLHEYMAAARPTIVAGCAYNNPVAEARAGITVPPEDSQAIAVAVETLAAMSSDERWRMGLCARQYVEEHHDFTALARCLERVLQSALPRADDAVVGTLNVDAGNPARAEVSSVNHQ
jgi:glycosyltransferase involved in cell wall biosynthesis